MSLLLIVLLVRWKLPSPFHVSMGIAIYKSSKHTFLIAVEVCDSWMTMFVLWATGDPIECANFTGEMVTRDSLTCIFTSLSPRNAVAAGTSFFVGASCLNTSLAVQTQVRARCKATVCLVLAPATLI